MKKETYKTDHPTIKEITIGDQFITYGGDVLRFEELSNNATLYIYGFKNNRGHMFQYTMKLKFISSSIYSEKDIKDKINYKFILSLL